MRLRFLLVVAFVVVVFGLWRIPGYVKRAYIGSGASSEAQRVEITGTFSNKELATFLTEQGIVTHPRELRVYLALADDVNVKEGVYTLRPGQAYRDLLLQLEHGPVREETTLRIIEGWGIRDIEAYLEKQSVDAQVYVGQTGSPIGDTAFDPNLRAKYEFLRDLPLTRSLEGYLVPNTYRVWKDDAANGLLAKQLALFESKVAQPLAGMKPPAPLKDLDEAVILASIVEKEVPSADDRKIVAGIFLNRLRIGMALQSDATLTYITGSKRGRATSKELELESEFNSYKNRGLPPSPISNPSVEAIQAVYAPADTPYFYFLTDAKGKVYYARTLEEHVANRRAAGY